jgi:hypothetical protein
MFLEVLMLSLRRSAAIVGLAFSTLLSVGVSTTEAANPASSFLAPTVTGLHPASGALSGGTSVVISGANFHSPATVAFGGAAATDVVVQNESHILATSPAGTGTVDVTVTTAGGTSATSSADQFTYYPQPTVSGVSPNTGQSGGNQTITISGSNFVGLTTRVQFGTAYAGNVVRLNSSTITVTSPKGSGTVDVTVTTRGGMSPTSSADQFTYTSRPSVNQVSPEAGPVAGGNTVTISGGSFVAPATVMFGGTAATNVVVVNSGTITATAPAESPYRRGVYVTVTTVGGTSKALGGYVQDRYNYIPLPNITRITPNTGSTLGGTSVLIRTHSAYYYIYGRTGSSAVIFGTTPANVTYVSTRDNYIIATSPPGTGTVAVTLVTSGGTSTPSAATQFTYVAGS